MMPTKARRRLVCLAALVLLTAGTARAGTVTGRVVDPEGRPIPDVEIWQPATLAERLGRAERVPAAVSGPDGLFTIPNPQGTLTACPPGWLYAEVEPLSQSSPGLVELRLQPAARMSGRVVDGRGEPVPGVLVEARFAGWAAGCVVFSPPQPCPGNSRFRHEPTDADGRFVFEALEPGWFEVSASHDSRPPVVRWQGVAGESGREVEIVLLGKPVPLEGRVVDGEGRPVEGAQVRVSGALSGSETQTDKAGIYRVPRILPGTRQVRVSHPDFGWIEKEVRIGESPARLDLRLPPATVIQGRILGRDGSPVARPRLTVDWNDVEVDPDGHFRFHVSPGEHVVRVEALRWITAERPVTATGDPIELDIGLSRPASVVGRLTGLPPGVRGAVELKEGPQERHARMGADEDGRFGVYNVPPGTWTLVASDNNGRTLKRRIEVEEGREVQVGDLQFPPLLPVRGRVLDPEGQAVPEATVTFQQGENTVFAGTDAEGRFTAHLVDGTWTVKAEKQGLGPAASTVTLSGAPAEVPDFRLVRTVALSGYVRGLAPGEVPFVQARSEDGVWTRGAYAAQDQRFQIPDLWPGTWILTTGIGDRETSTRVRILPSDTAVRADLVFEE